MTQPETPTSKPARVPMRRRDYLSAAIIAACMIALIVPYLMPVLILDRADPITRLAGREVRATISGIKLRNCPPLKGSFVGWSLGPDGWREVGFDWVGDLSPDSPNPAAWGRHGGGRCSARRAGMALAGQRSRCA